MRLVEVIRGLGVGGAETLLVQRMVAADAPTRDSTTVLNCYPALSDFKAQLQALGVRVVETRSSGLARSILHVLSFAHSHPDCVVLVHSPLPATALKIAGLMRLVRNPIIQVVHSAEYKKIYGLAGRVLNGEASGCICVSAEAAESTATAAFRRVHVVYGGVDTVRMAAELDGVLANDAYYPRRGKDTVQLCCVGSLLERKGHAHLLKALSYSHPRIHLTIIGEGPERENLERLIADLGLGDRVRMLGSQRDAWRWMIAADALCHTSWAEGLPVVLMEALSLGTPVIATNFAGAKEAYERSGGLTILRTRETSELADALNSVKRRQVTGQEVRDNLESSYWNIVRFREEFYAAVSAIASDQSGVTSVAAS